jgi:hypothetical protein
MRQTPPINTTPRKSDIDTQSRLQIAPQSITEDTALRAWWQSLPETLRSDLKYRMVLFTYDEQKHPTSWPTPLLHR